MRHPVLIFDFGNVVGLFDYSLMFARFAPRLGLSAPQLEALMHERGVPALALEFERGGTHHDEFMTTVIGLAGLEISHKEFEAGWVDIFTLNEPVARLVAFLKRRGYTLLLGSNTNILHARFFRRRFAQTLDLFDHLVLSYEVGAVKPDRAFFRACVARAGVPASSCVFIDDAAANVEGARAEGLVALQYRDTPTLIDELRALGVEVPDAAEVAGAEA
jgi:putative hydrolase of the HAD superfamily